MEFRVCRLVFPFFLLKYRSTPRGFGVTSRHPTPTAPSLPVDPFHEVFELEPIDCAIEEMERKVETVRNAATAAEPDMIFLQMQLQGTLSLQVNAGPLEYARTFCSPKSKYDPAKVRVRLEDAHFLHRGPGILHDGRPFLLEKSAPFLNDACGACWHSFAHSARPPLPLSC
jgi:hypothetical protein